MFFVKWDSTKIPPRSATLFGRKDFRRRNGDTAALTQEGGGKPLTGAVRVMPDGSISLRVKENVPRSAANPDGQRVRDVPVKDKTKLVKLIDNGGMRFKSGESGVTPKEDAAYMGAVRRGDMETAQRMVREAATRAVPIVNIAPTRMVDPMWIITPNAIQDQSKFKWIAEDMKRNGWRGRPILAWNEDGDLFRAFTGSHRTFAAKEAEIDVPVYELSQEQLDSFSSFLDDVGTWDINDWINNLDDSDKATWLERAVEEGGLEELREAAELMREEVDSEESSWNGHYLDPVTYDDAGNVIPLSQRFNPEKADLRFKRGGTTTDGIEIYETNDDVRRLPYKERIKRFRDLMANEYAGRTARFVRNGKTYYATFDKNGIKKNLFGDNQSDLKGFKAKVNVGASGDIFDLVENARYSHTSPESGKANHAHDGVRSWDYFDKTVQIDGRRFDVLVNVRDKGDNQFVYNVALAESKNIKPDSALTHEAPYGGGLSGSTESSVSQTAAGSQIGRTTPVGVQKVAGVEYPDAGREISGLRFKVGGVYTGTAADYANRSRQGGVDDGPSVKKIGTGEGSQVYGWGLYGSTVRGVAEGYATLNSGAYLKNGKPISDYFERTVAEALDDYGWDVAKTISGLQEKNKTLGTAARKENNAIIKELRAHGEEYRRKSGSIYEQTWFTNRAEGDESHLLKWYKPVSAQQLKWINDALAKDGLSPLDFTREASQFDAMMRPVKRFSGETVYGALTRRFGNSPQAASEFLYRAGIDGIKYPVDSYGGKTVKDGDKAGWNYVAFSDEHIRVDHKWTDGQMRFKRNAAFEHSLDALQAIADGADYGVLHNAKYGEIRYPLGRSGKGGMGFLHIVQSRMDKDGATLDEAIDTAIKVGQAVEIGEETAERLNTRHFDYDGVRAIVAWRENDKAVITGYEINEGDSAAAVRRAEELAPRPHVSSEEVAQRLRDRIANLRAEGNSDAASGLRFKRGENERPADDTSVWFGAKASMAAHGFDARTAKEMGINITNKGTVAAARSLVADVRRMNEIITFALTSDRPLSAEENTALVILAQNLNADLGRINQMMSESANPSVFQAEKELVEAKYNKALEALNKAGTHTGQSMQSLKIGIPDDVRDSEIYILRSIQAERRKQGAAPDDAADTATAKAMHDDRQKLIDRVKELEKQVADLSQSGVKEKRAAENVSKGKSEARGATLSPERRARAAKVVGHSIDDEDASILAGFNAEFGEALSFKGGLNEKGSVLSDNAKALFAAYVKKHGYDETERVLKSQYPKAMSAWAEFRRQNEKKSAEDLAKLALPVTKQRLVTTRDLAEARKECKRQLDENAGDPYQQRIAIGHYLRRYMDALINENPDVPMKELQEKMAEEATDLTGTKHDPVAMLAVMAGVEGYDLETRTEILRKIAKSRHALQLFREGKVNEAARESGLLYEDEATALDQLQKTLEQIIMEKQNEIDYLSAFSEKNKEAVERVKQLKADLKEAEDALAIMHKQVSLAERKAKFAEVLEKRIAEAQQAADALRGEVESDEFKERKAKIDTKIAELKAALAVAKRDEMSLKKIQDKIAEYEKRIADGDYDRALQTYRANDAKLQAKLALARERRKELRRKHEAAIRARNYREMGIIGKTLYGTMGILGEMKGVVASFDLSSVLRQGGQLSWAHPFIASKNLKTVLAAMSDEKKCDELMAQLRLRPNWKYYEQAGVEFTDYGEGATNKEDVFLLNQYRRITNAKLLKAGVQMSERAFTTFLNLMRADVFDAMVGGSTFGSAANMNDSQLKAIGRFINIASQRGTHDMGVGLAAKIVNTLLWSPRNVVSRFQFLWETGKLLGGGAAYGDKTLRSLFAKELVRYIGGMSAAAMFLKAVAELFRDDDDPPNEMEFDPRSSDFLKVRFGNVRVDLTSGLTPILVFGARFFSRKSKNLRGQTRDFNAAEGFGKFLRQKFSPSAAIVWDLAHGEDFEKRDIEWTSLWEKDNERISAYRYLLGSFAPLSVADLMEQAEQGGLPKTFVTGAMSLLGANVQAFDPYNFKQLKGDYTYFKGLYDKAIDPEERRHLLEYHPMLKRRSRIESALKRVRDLENIKKKAEKRGYQRLDLDEPIKRAKEVAIGIMAGID